MSTYQIGQSVWKIQTSTTSRGKHIISELQLGFFNERIREIMIRKSRSGDSISYLLSNGQSLSEENIFSTKNEAIDFVITLLEMEKDHE